MSRGKRKKLRATLYAVNPFCPDCFMRMHIDPTDIRADRQLMATLDHIVPLARGGMDVAENIRLVCKGCNEAKGSQERPYFEFTPIQFAIGRPLE